MPTLLKMLLLIVTFTLGRFHSELSPHAYLWLLAGWVVMCAALAAGDARGGTRTHNATEGSPF